MRMLPPERPADSTSLSVPTDQQVATGTREQLIFARAAEEDGVSTARGEHIVAGAAVDEHRDADELDTVAKSLPRPDAIVTSVTAAEGKR